MYNQVINQSNNIMYHYIIQAIQNKINTGDKDFKEKKVNKVLTKYNCNSNFNDDITSTISRIIQAPKPL